jgi:hypothetical protein
MGLFRKNGLPFTNETADGASYAGFGVSFAGRWAKAIGYDGFLRYRQALYRHQSRAVSPDTAWTRAARTPPVLVEPRCPNISFKVLPVCLRK